MTADEYTEEPTHTDTHTDIQTYTTPVSYTDTLQQLELREQQQSLTPTASS